MNELRCHSEPTRLHYQSKSVASLKANRQNPSTLNRIKWCTSIFERYTMSTPIYSSSTSMRVFQASFIQIDWPNEVVSIERICSRHTVWHSFTKSPTIRVPSHIMDGSFDIYLQPLNTRSHSVHDGSIIARIQAVLWSIYTTIIGIIQGIYSGSVHMQYV